MWSTQRHIVYIFRFYCRTRQLLNTMYAYCTRYLHLSSTKVHLEIFLLNMLLPRNKNSEISDILSTTFRFGFKKHAPLLCEILCPFASPPRSPVTPQTSSRNNTSDSPNEFLSITLKHHYIQRYLSTYRWNNGKNFIH